MAQQLRLKSQKALSKEEFSFSVEVMVDTGITHLTEPFSYAVSPKDSKVDVGFLVSVPFGSRNLTGLVIAKSKVKKEGLKFIKKVLHENAVINHEQIDLINKAKERWTGGFWNYLKFALPSIPLKIQVPVIQEEGIPRKVEKPELKIGGSYQDLLQVITSRINPTRQFLIVAPDSNMLNFLRKNLRSQFIEYGSHLDNSERVKNYLKILSGAPNLIIGSRSAIFLPLRKDAEILVIDDLSFEFYETRFPYWNVRDLALLRSPSHSITFYSHSPSLELVRLVESNWLRIKAKKLERTKIFFDDGRISSSTVIKSGLASGTVLVIAPEKGYINTLVCKSCRNIKHCKSCNGRMIKVSDASPMSCAQCLAIEENNECVFCNSKETLIFRKGIDRSLEELGMQFPGAIINKYNGGELKIKKGQIVATTYSNIPIMKYSAVISLGTERFGYQNSLRSSEIARKKFFDLLALNADQYFFNLPSSDYFSQNLLLGDSFKACVRELQEREVAKLPPFYRIAIIECDSKAVPIFEEQPFVHSVIFKKGRALIKVKIEDAARLSEFLQGLSKYRSLRKLKPWNVKVDPLDL